MLQAERQQGSATYVCFQTPPPTPGLFLNFLPHKNADFANYKNVDLIIKAQVRNAHARKKEKKKKINFNFNFWDLSPKKELMRMLYRANKTMIVHWLRRVKESRPTGSCFFHHSSLSTAHWEYWSMGLSDSRHQAIFHHKLDCTSFTWLTEQGIILDH